MAQYLKANYFEPSDSIKSLSFNVFALTLAWHLQLCSRTVRVTCKQAWKSLANPACSACAVLKSSNFKEFPIGYDEIYKHRQKVVTEPKYLAVIKAAYAIRKDDKIPNIDILYENISLLDSLIEPAIIAAFKSDGNKTVS